MWVLHCPTVWVLSLQPVWVCDISGFCSELFWFVGPAEMLPVWRLGSPSSAHPSRASVFLLLHLGYFCAGSPLNRTKILRDSPQNLEKKKKKTLSAADCTKRGNAKKKMSSKLWKWKSRFISSKTSKPLQQEADPPKAAVSLPWLAGKERLYCTGAQRGQREVVQMQDSQLSSDREDYSESKAKLSVLIPTANWDAVRSSSEGLAPTHRSYLPFGERLKKIYPELRGKTRNEVEEEGETLSNKDSFIGCSNNVQNICGRR